MEFLKDIQTRLYVCSTGEEVCEPRHSYGPALRGYHLMHLVLSGCGTFENAHGTHPVRAGEGFMIFPEDITIYTADADMPWHYVWVGYSGSLAEDATRAAGLSPEHPVIHLGDMAQDAMDTARRINADASRLKWRDAAATGGLLRLLALIEQGRDGGVSIDTGANESYKRAMWYINAHYQTPDMRIEEVARFVNLSRSQLFRVFRAQCGQSPRQVLGQMRLNLACRLLRETSLSLKEVALSSGFSSAARMGEVFRESLGLSPGQYRKTAVGDPDGRA